MARGKFNPIVSLPRFFSFQEPALLHPKDTAGQTIADVARFIEADYDLLHIFYEMKKAEIKSIIIQEVKLAWKYGRDQEIVNNIISDKIKSLYRQFMLRAEHGIKTKAAMDNNRQSFLDTGAYVAGMRVKVG